ncbi:MAG: NMD3-related protein [Candidatus Bilamarchaeum sp.]|jgi:nonsense-mediated mRNA decay protein 3
MTDLICPKCGRSSHGLEFIESFCVDCYPVKVKTLDKLEVTQCKKCSRMMLQGQWKPFSLRDISEFIESKCRGDFKKVIYDPETQTAEFLMTSGAFIKRTIPLTILQNMCPDCNKISGDYFEAIIQLRGDPKKVEKYAIMLIDRLEKKTFINKTEDSKNGVDIYVGNSKAVVSVINEIKYRCLITQKLVGADQGRRLFRTTFLIRFDEKGMKGNQKGRKMKEEEDEKESDGDET